MAVDPSVRIDIAAEFTGKKAFDKAAKSTTSLEKNVKKLAGAFGLAFSTRAVVNFSKQAVKAFAEDDAAITVLRQNLKNLGLAYQSVNAENFIGKLEQQTGILDDELRPAYAKLSKVTLSTTKTQELMALAVDVARANGLAFSDVVNTLSQAYVGNYKGLKQLNTGLTAAELATKDFAEIQAILINQSKGANKAYIDTFAGSIDKLAVASANAKEVIGEGLVDLFADMAGNGDIDAATANVNKFATAVSDLLKDVSEYNLLDFISAFASGNITEGTASKLVKRPSARRFFTGGSGVSTELLAARKAAAAAAAKIKADKLAAANKIKADKLAAANKAKLDKAAAVFDIQRIQIAAALKGKITDEEKTRLLLMQAIEEGNADKAETLAKKLADIQEKNAEIAQSLIEISKVDNPFQAWVDSLTAASTLLGTIGTQSSGSGMPALFKPDGSLTGRGKINIPTGGDLPSFNDVTTPTAIADAVVNVAEGIVEAAAEAIVAEVPNILGGFGASVPGLAEFIASAGITAAETPTNVSASPMGSTGGFGFSLPSYLQNTIPQTPTIIVNNNGSVIMQDEFIDAVNDAVLASIRVGYGRTPAGLIG